LIINFLFDDHFFNTIYSLNLKVEQNLTEKQKKFDIKV